MEVSINQFDYKKSIFDYNKINSLYDFYLIESKGLSFKRDSNILYEPLFEKNILAIQYTSGSGFIVMLQKNLLNKNVILELINKYNEEFNNNLTQKQLFAPFDKFPHSLLQLFFNSLAKSKNNDNFSNIAGKLYYFSEIKGKQLYCLDLKINPDFSFSLKSKTFTETLKDSKQKKFILQPNNTLKLAEKNNKGLKQYVEFQYKNTKHSITFTDTSNLQAFETSKTGIFYKILEKFNKTYGDIIKLHLAIDTDWTKLEVKSSASKKIEHLRHLKKILTGKTINIVDNIKDSSSKYFCKQLQDTYEQIFTNEKYFTKDNITSKIKFVISEKVNKNALNININHHKPFYEVNTDELDTYKRSTNEIIQNVSLEDFPQSKQHELSEAACIVLLNELVIKQDLIKSKSISIINWAEYGFEKSVTFCLQDQEIINEKEINHYYFMTIDPDGKFIAGEKTKDLFNQEFYEKIEEIFELNNMKAERHNRYDEKYKGLIINDRDEINIIQDTPFIMMPNISIISEDLKKGKLSRKKEDLIKYYGGCLDIYLKNNSDEILYSSGQIGSGMNTSIEKGTHIRKIIPYKNYPIFCQKYIESMNVTFVRNGQLTVIPFPFKYLREYTKFSTNTHEIVLQCIK